MGNQSEAARTVDVCVRRVVEAAFYEAERLGLFCPPMYEVLIEGQPDYFEALQGMTPRPNASRNAEKWLSAAVHASKEVVTPANVSVRLLHPQRITRGKGKETCVVLRFKARGVGERLVLLSTEGDE